MRTRPVPILTTLVVTLVLAGQLSAQAPALLLGTWRLNVARSTNRDGPPTFTRGTCRIEAWEDGLQVTYDMVRPRGGVTHLEWRGRIDGRDYAIQGIDTVVTNAYTRIDDRTYRIVQKFDGAVASTAQLVISVDGKTITTVTANATGSEAPTTTVYDREGS